MAKTNLTIISIDLGKEVEIPKSISEVLSKFVLSSYVTMKGKIFCLEIIVPPYHKKEVSDILKKDISYSEREYTPKVISK